MVVFCLNLHAFAACAQALLSVPSHPTSEGFFVASVALFIPRCVYLVASSGRPSRWDQALAIFPLLGPLQGFIKLEEARFHP